MKAPSKSTKPKRTLSPAIEDGPASKKAKKPKCQLLPMPPDYKGYPTCKYLTSYIKESQVTDTPLSEEDVQQVLNVLDWTCKIERVAAAQDDPNDQSAWAYKAIRAAVMDNDADLEPGNHGLGFQLPTAPCLRCPIFELCEEGGPISPSNCEYWAEYLDK